MRRPNKPLLTLFLLVLTSPALAHPFHTPSLPASVAGFLHPLTGWDHLLTTLAVGLWCARVSRKSRLLLPTTFLLAMALGGLLTTPGLALPLTEHALLVSTIALTLLAALAIRPPLLLAAAITATFACFHGHAHIAELPPTAAIAPYTAGFLLSTTLLLTAGVALGTLLSTWHARNLISMKPN